MEEEDIDEISLIGVQSFMEEQKRKIEEVKIMTNHWEMNIEDKVAIIRKEVEEKIVVISDRVVEAFYKDDNSITIMEEGIESVSVVNSRPNYKIFISTAFRSKENTFPLPIRPNTILQIINEPLIASIIIIESLA